MAVSVPAAIIISSVISAGASAIAANEASKNTPKPTPPPDPSIARNQQLADLNTADQARTRAITAQKQYDNQFITDIRNNGFKL